MSARCGTPAAPRLFMYDLPDSYRHGGLLQDAVRRNRIDTRWGVGNVSTIRLPAHLFVGLNDLGQLHWRKGNYWTSAAFYRQAQDYACSTHDAEQADLFFVPVFNDSPAPEPCESPCRDAVRALKNRSAAAAVQQRCARDSLFHRLQGLGGDRSGGSFMETHASRHILHSPRHAEKDVPSQMMPCGTHEFSLEDARLQPMTRLAVEALTPTPLQGIRHSAGFRSVPSLSYVHAAPTTRWHDLPWRRRPARGLLVAAAFIVKQMTSKRTGMLAIRSALARACGRRNHSCALTTFAKADHYSGELPAAAALRTLSMYWNATFCMHPVGDACVRTGVIDSLLLGCIPVVFHRCQLEQWAWHWGDWAAHATLFFDAEEVISGAVDPVAELQRVPAARVAKMRRVIAEHAHCLHYRRPTQSEVAKHRAPVGAAGMGGTAADAFDITLEATLWHATHPQARESLTFCVRVPWPKIK